MFYSSFYEKNYICFFNKYYPRSFRLTVLYQFPNRKSLWYMNNLRFVSYAIRRFFIFGLFFYFLLCLISIVIIQFVIDCQTCPPPIYNNRFLVLSSLPTEEKRRKAGVSRFC